jgi:uncharacterized protein involved in oxidation of intracellular sulfur
MSARPTTVGECLERKRGSCSQPARQTEQLTHLQSLGLRSRLALDLNQYDETIGVEGTDTGSVPKADADANARESSAAPANSPNGLAAMKVLFIINDPPYGTERVYNALRLAQALLKRDRSTGVTVFLMADAVLAAKAQQKTPDGYYNIERMLRRLLTSEAAVLLCGTCMDARGLRDEELTASARRSTMDELAAATAEADKVMVF